VPNSPTKTGAARRCGAVAIDPVIKKRLEKLAKGTGRSRSFLAAEATNEYLELNEWQVAGKAYHPYFKTNPILVLRNSDRSASLHRLRFAELTAARHQDFQDEARPVVSDRA
jgi:hypothetical protein